MRLDSGDDSSCPDGVNIGDPTYAEKKIECLADESEDISPDTLQGSYKLIAGVLCSINEVYDFQYLATATIENNLQISRSDSCPDLVLEQADISLIEKSLGDDSDFDYYVGIQMAESFTEAQWKVF